MGSPGDEFRGADALVQAVGPRMHKTSFWLRVLARLLQRGGYPAGIDNHFILLIGLL
jgi:hypothetical protein